MLKTCGLRLLRIPGLALFYTENIQSVPGAFKRLLLKSPVLHRTIVFITVRQVNGPTVCTHPSHKIVLTQQPSGSANCVALVKKSLCSLISTIGVPLFHLDDTELVSRLKVHEFLWTLADRPPSQCILACLNA